MNNRGGFRRGGGGRPQAGGKRFGNAQGKKRPNPNACGDIACPVCDFVCDSVQKLKTHFTRTNHRLVGELMKQNEGKGDSGPGDPAGKVPDHIRRSIFILKDYIHRADREPVVGLEHIVEYRLQVRPDKSDVKYFCEICDLDCDLLPMVEHLSSLRHRKLYMAKEYPYVLKAPSGNKEDRALFLRRMAMEIERDQGTKMYKTDPNMRKVPMMSAKAAAAAKQSNRSTRWDSEGNRQRRMKKSLEYLESFEIDNDCEASTVTRLTEKLTAELKFYSDKLKEEALFPAKVARAKDVAMSLMQNVSRGRMAQQNPVQKAPMQKSPMQKAPPMSNKGPPENLNLRHNVGMPSAPPQPKHEKPYWNPNPAFPQRPQESPFPPVNQNRNFEMAVAQENYQKAQAALPNPEPQADQSGEKFLKKLTALLSVLPQRNKPTDSAQMSSKLMALKSLLQDKAANAEQNAANRLRLQDMESAALNQQMSMMAARNVAPMGQFNQNAMLQMAPMAENAFPMENAPVNQNSLIQMAALLQNRQMNMNSLLQEDQNIQNQEYIQMGNSAAMQMDQSAYRQPYADLGYESGMYGREWDESSYSNISQAANPEFGDYTARQPPFTRVSLSPSNPRLENESFDDDYRELRESRSQEARRGSRSFDDPAWVERERELHYGKRTKLDSDHVPMQSPERGRHHSDESGSLGVNLSADLLKRIRGKDLFTVTAILNEYAESNSK